MTQKHYPDAPPSPDFPKLEEEVLALWQKEGTFQKSIDARAGAVDYVFYDGPPFANGLPHYGHLLTGYVKDVFARYHTMRGKRVERRFGWDCHGLPAEMGSEKELGISGRAAIQNFGIDKFNEHCRTSVMKYTHEWEHYVTRQARWVDFKNDYKTMDTNFMESVLWAFKQLYDKGLVYEAHRVMPYSWAAETPLSNFETKLDNSYREREDKAITVAFQLIPPASGGDVRGGIWDILPKADKYYVLAWTTTPWTLPSNLALGVNAEMDYVCVRHPGEGRDPICYILSVNALGKYVKEFGLEDEKILDPGLRRDDAIKGADLIGLTYKPLFPYFANHPNAFKILDGSSFVTDGDGTGVVHLAPGFGEDDQKACEANGIELVVPVDGQGKYTDEIFDIPSSCGPRSGSTGSQESASDPAQSLRDSQDDIPLSLRGLNVIADTRKSDDEPYKEEQLKKFGLANLRIIKWLKDTGALIKEEQIKHNYPHCWRTDTPLIYRAMPSWYVEVTKFRDRAVDLNREINWIPDHVRDGQMGHMLATAPDWSISRNRFWGTPIPVWRRQESGIRNQESEIKVFGSIAELEDFFGVKVQDLHRPFIDTLTTAKDGSRWQRVEDVFDCWFESGSMPFAQVHYPFENKEAFHANFPADFITEYVGQTRGWFNTLIMLSTALFDKPPFKNCICHGVVLDAETGLKYSKRLKNYKDPLEVINHYGADALRWLMLESPVMRGQDLMVDPEGKFIRDVVRLAIKPIWNAYHFFCLYANADSIVARESCLVGREGDQRTTNVMDRYILAKCAEAVRAIQASMDAYDTPGACQAVTQFFDVLNNWYIRRSKERFWKEEKDADKQAAYNTLHTVLVTMCKAAAPLLPLTCEAIYQGLTGEESVHLAEFPLSSCGPQSGSTGSREDGADPAQSLRASQDDDLIKHMDWVRDVCNAALSIRNKMNIRVRQPLRTLTVATNKSWESVEPSGGVIGSLVDIIREEVNVKEYCISSSFAEVATLRLSLNNAVLGKRLPEKMKQIIPASKKGEWQQVDGAVEICGERLLPEEYTLQLEPKPEFKDRAAALSTNDALVILDTTITPELEAEGYARDIIRAIQQTRKDAGLHVADRIALSIAASPLLVSAIEAHRTSITEATLAASLQVVAEAKGAFVAENTIDEHRVVIALSRV